MRIVIDLQGAQSHSRFRGIGRYALSLAQAIAKNRGKHEVVIVLNGMFPETLTSIREAFYKILPKKNIRVWLGSAPTHCSDSQNDNRIASSSLLREAFLSSLHPDIVLIMSAVEGYTDNTIVSLPKRYTFPIATIFYDAIPYIQAEKYITPLGKRFEQYYYEKIEVIKQSDLIFAISNSSRQEAIDILQIPKEKIININAAVDKEKFKPLAYSEDEKRKKLNKLNISKKFILYSGATDERKNHLRLIKAFSLLPEKYKNEYQLVIAGGIPQENKIKFKEYARKNKLSSNQVVFTDRISDNELIDLYNLCELYVFPSYHEGFGLPALEAMQCGAATIGANTTSVPEVIGREDALFDPFDEEDIAQKIEQVLSDEKFKNELKKHSILQSKKFSWDKSAKTVLVSIEKMNLNRKKQFEKETIDYIDNLIKDIAKIPNEKQDLLQISQAIAFNHRSSNQKQLLIDISELIQHDAKSGIQRVVRNILKEIYKNPPKGYIPRAVYATKKKQGYLYAEKFIASFLNHEEDTNISDRHIDINFGDIFLGLDMSPDIQIYQEEFLKKLQNYGVNINFIVYDLLLVKHPEWWPDGAHINFKQWLYSVINVSDDIYCISENVAKELQDYISNSLSKNRIVPNINYFHLGADVLNSPVQGYIDKNNNIATLLSAKFIFLMVGTLEPRKGHKQVLQAFEILWNQDIDVNLVIVGKKGWLVEDLIKKIKSHPELNKRLFWLEAISDEYLEQVYSASSCLIAASEGEGFGLPLIEAAQKKKPIIARDIPVFREVAGEYAYYFENSKEPEILAKAIKEWIELYKLNKHPKSDDMPWLTWEESTKQLLQSMGIV